MSLRQDAGVEAALFRLARRVVPKAVQPQAARLYGSMKFRLASWLFPSDLVRLAQAAGTDKCGDHSYCRHYERHIGHLRRRRFTLLEIGIGGYADPDRGGESLLMWHTYFPRATIAGIDLHPKRIPARSRLRVFQGDQADAAFLGRVVAEMGGVDVVIDDGSHVNAHVIASFEALFPRLPDGGIYVVEDTQTSYWPDFGGHMEAAADPGTTMGYFLRLANGINHAEMPGRLAAKFERDIVTMHFYHNLIFIEKGQNDEPSNIVQPPAGYDSGASRVI